MGSANQTFISPHLAPEQERAVLPELAGSVLHHEEQGRPGLGALPQDGDLGRVLPAAAAHRKRLLQDGRLLLLGQGTDIVIEC